MLGSAKVIDKNSVNFSLNFRHFFQLIALDMTNYRPSGFSIQLTLNRNITNQSGLLSLGRGILPILRCSCESGWFETLINDQSKVKHSLGLFNPNVLKLRIGLPPEAILFQATTSITKQINIMTRGIEPIECSDVMVRFDKLLLRAAENKRKEIIDRYGQEGCTKLLAKQEGKKEDPEFFFFRTNSTKKSRERYSESHGFLGSVTQEQIQKNQDN
jgi:hypothetical protein